MTSNALKHECLFLKITDIFCSLSYTHASQSILAHGTLKKQQNLLRNTLPVHKISDIKLHTSICLSLMYITFNKSTDNLKLIT
jgi:hypothetical protein